jgi:serine phosphatase RsbU (regulator of sigma subunit)
MDSVITPCLPRLPSLGHRSPGAASSGGVRATDLDLPTVSGLRVATRQSAQLGAGGDFFEVFQHSDGRISTVVADVCGNGAAAARIADAVRPFLHRSLARGESPGRVLEAFNDGLMNHGLGDRFVTAVAVRIDVYTGWVEIACAGHMGPFVRSVSGQVESLNRAVGVPLGLLSGETYDEISLELEPEDALVLVTDGITDPLSAEGDPLGEAALVQRLEAAPHFATGICRALLADGTSTRDDATVLVLHLPMREAMALAA